MAAPTPYVRAYSFQAYQTANPSRPLPADKLETEMSAISLTTDEIIANLGLIQRSDGALANGSVGYDQLDEALYAGFRQPAAWVTTTAYLADDSVYSGSSLYRCITAHTSGTFATDLAAGKWGLLIDLSFGATAISWGDIGGVVADQADLVAAFQAKDADLTTWAGLTPSANAQSLVTAANYAAMRALLDLEAGTDFYSITAADTAFQPKDSDLTAIATLTATTDNFIQSKSSAWASRTPAQVMVDLHITPTIAEKTSAGSYTMLDADDHILVNKSSGAATTVDLVTAVSRTRPVKIVDLKGDAATNNITIDGNLAETIVGLSTYVLKNNYASVVLWPKSDGSGWYI